MSGVGTPTGRPMFCPATGSGVGAWPAKYHEPPTTGALSAEADDGNRPTTTTPKTAINAVRRNLRMTRPPIGLLPRCGAGAYWTSVKPPRSPPSAAGRPGHLGPDAP